MKISIIIVTWNKKDLLKDCLNSLKKQTYKKFQIIIVDNYSKDKTLEFIRKYYPEVKVISLKRNFGFSVSVNKGIKASSSDYIILLNNDTVVGKNFVKYLFESLGKNKNNKYCASTAKIIDYSNRNILASAGDFMNNVGQSFPRGLNEKANIFNKSEEVFLITGGASIFKKSVFGEIGYFDEDYFFSGEDSDWCLRAQLLGYKFLYEPKAIVYHHQKATSEIMSKEINYFHFRNMMITIIKNFPTALFFRRWRFITIPLTSLNTTLYLSFTGCLKEAMLAHFWVIKNLHQILKKRHSIQLKRNVSINYLNNWLQPKKIRFYGLSK
jgi:hypothetical protein